MEFNPPESIWKVQGQKLENGWIPKALFLTQELAIEAQKILEDQKIEVEIIKIKVEEGENKWSKCEVNGYYVERFGKVLNVWDQVTPGILLRFEP